MHARVSLGSRRRSIEPKRSRSAAACGARERPLSLASKVSGATLRTSFVESER